MHKIKARLGVDSKSVTAAYIQIATQLKDLIGKGALLPGTRFTERELAEIYKVGRSTITAALDVLKESGLIETIPKKGTFVKESVWASFVERSIPDWCRYIKQGSYPENNKIVTPAYNMPKKMGSVYALSESYAPYEPLRKAYRDLAEDTNLYNDLNTFSAMGSQALRSILVPHLAKQGIKTEVGNIVLFPGYVEALSTISRAFLTHGSNLYCMQTDQIASYPTFRSVGVNIYEVPGDNHGLIPENFEKMIKHGKLNMLYINPVSCFPTGITHSAGRLAAIKDICLKHNFPIIENNFLGDFWVKQPPQPMKASDNHNQVIYIGAMGMNFASGATLAWVVLPEMAVDRLLYVKMFMHTPSNSSNELLAYMMLRNGYYQEYMDDLRKKLPDIVRMARESLTKHLTGLAEWEPDNLAYTCWLKLKNNINADAIVQENPYYINSGKVFTNDHNHIFAYTLSMTPEQFDSMAFHCAQSIKKRL